MRWTCHTISTIAQYAVLLLIVPCLSSCGSGPKITPERTHWVEEDQSIEKPAGASSSLAWDAIDNTLFDQALQFFDIERDFRIISGNRKESRNVNAFDEVPNSSWFTNRHHLFPLSLDELARGPNTSDGPDTAGTWLVFRPKVGGATPGFWIEDSRGRQYIIKFDPLENPELATGAAAIGSRYFHACGYNVPQETIVHWHPENLRIKEGVTYKNSGGERMAFTRQVLDSILIDAHRAPDGTIRSLASLALPNVIGPFSYKGRRSDDPNDWCPHQDRRELRALYVIASLINHYDTKDQNTLTTYESVNGKNVVMHYLIDFGSVLGSDGDNAKGPKQGYANLFDLRDALVSLFTLGLKDWGWQHAEPQEYPSIGYFESEIFQPDKFDPIQPNPAFEEMTQRDAYWGAKIVMSFDEADIRALVAAGEYSDAEAEEYLVKTLLKRREKIGRYWFGKVNPLDEFAFRYSPEATSLHFSDLAVKYALVLAGGNEYRYAVKHGSDTIIPGRATSGTEIRLTGEDLGALRAAFSPTGAETDPGERLYHIEVNTKRPGSNWSKPTLVWLALNPTDGAFTMVGIEHLD